MLLIILLSTIIVINIVAPLVIADWVNVMNGWWGNIMKFLWEWTAEEVIRGVWSDAIGYEKLISIIHTHVFIFTKVLIITKIQAVWGLCLMLTIISVTLNWICKFQNLVIVRGVQMCCRKEGTWTILLNHIIHLIALRNTFWTITCILFRFFILNLLHLFII